MLKISAMSYFDSLCRWKVLYKICKILYYKLELIQTYFIKSYKIYSKNLKISQNFLLLNSL